MNASLTAGSVGADRPGWLTAGAEIVLNLGISKTPVRVTCIGPSDAKPIALWLDAVINAFRVGHVLEEILRPQQMGVEFEPDGWIEDVLAERNNRHGNLLAYKRMLAREIPTGPATRIGDAPTVGKAGADQVPEKL